jgi:hypothetical protein
MARVDLWPPSVGTDIQRTINVWMVRWKLAGGGGVNWGSVAGRGAGKRGWIVNVWTEWNFILEKVWAPAVLRTLEKNN